jgi:hypothetical protein
MASHYRVGVQDVPIGLCTGRPEFAKMRAESKKAGIQGVSLTLRSYKQAEFVISCSLVVTVWQPTSRECLGEPRYLVEHGPIEQSFTHRGRRHRPSLGHRRWYRGGGRSGRGDRPEGGCRSSGEDCQLRTGAKGHDPKRPGVLVRSPLPV